MASAPDVWGKVCGVLTRAAVSFGQGDSSRKTPALRADWVVIVRCRVGVR